MERFRTYSEAKRRADTLVKDLAKGGQATALSHVQANDALAALERLRQFRQKTGRTLSLRAAVNELCEAAERLNGRLVADAIDGYLSTVASVKRKDLSSAVEEFIQTEQPRTKAVEGQRAQLSAKYTYTRDIRLRRFAAAFPGHAVCDLSKEHLDTFLTSKPVSAFSAKSRNHHRATIKQFLQWSVRKDYLGPTHRLNEADSMRPEHANTCEVATYTPVEFRALLETADGPMKAMVALGGLAGLRTEELLRLTWQDVWRVPGHVEVTAGKAKTRQRRLVEVCPALAAWLELFREIKTGSLWTGGEKLFQHRAFDLTKAAGVTRKSNGLRHSFCSYHFALHANENLTAAQAGNSPAMIHQHYKGLATKAEAEKWFNVQPAKAENVIPMTAATAGKQA
jgi:integrase